MKNRASKRFTDAFLREYDREQQLQDEAYYALFKTGQLCWWYVMYAPEYGFDWTEEAMKKYTDDAKNNILRIENEDVLNQEKVRLLTDTGINCRKLGNEFPYSVKIKMYRKKPKLDDMHMLNFQFSQAIEEVLFIELHTLYYQYHMDVDTLKKMIDGFMEFTKLYGKGLKDEHMIKYFQEVEQIPIIGEVGKDGIL